MKFTAEKIASFLNGTVEGNPEALVDNISKIEEGVPGTLSFLSNPKYTPYIYTTKASIVLVNKDFNAEKEISATLVRVEDAYKAFASLLELYSSVKPKKTGISKSAVIEESATIGENVYIGALAYVGFNVVIGNNVKIYPQVFLGDNVSVKENTIIFPGVKIYEDCVIGADCIFHAGVVIGGDGFGFAPQENEAYQKIPQLGNVIIEDNVEIGSNTTIDRATLGSTIIRKGVKLDNLIQVAHNVEIGENTVIAALAGISGSTKIGKNCMIGGQTGVAGHLKIPDGVKSGAQTGILSSHLKEGSIIAGTPGMDMKSFFKSMAVFKTLPELSKQINTIQQEINNLLSVNK